MKQLLFSTRALFRFSFNRYNGLITSVHNNLGLQRRSNFHTTGLANHHSSCGCRRGVTTSSGVKFQSCAAYGVKSSKSLLEPMTIERRLPTDQDVVVEICYCGICHSDLHWMRNEWKDSRYPMVPGHEIIGRVKSVGSQVDKFKVGDKVGVGLYVDSCRKCEHCTIGESNYCPQCVFVFNSPYERDGGRLTNGGFSKYVVVDQNYINRIPDSLEFSSVAPLLCAGVTVFTPMRRWQVGPGCRFAVNGMGGLGHLAVKLGAAMGAEVTVLSHSEKKRDDALRLGASDFIVSSDAKSMRKIKNRFDCLIDTVTVPHDMNAILGTLRVHGVMILVGLPEHPLSLQAHSVVLAARCISGSLIGSIDDAQKVIDFCAEKNVLPETEIIPIQKVNEAMERMIRSDVRYRFVIDMATLVAQK